MHTLEQLRSGALAGTRRLDLACDLTEVPEEVFGLADTLEVLNLSGNRLRKLPHQLTKLHKLQVLFASDNDFEVLPEVLGDCPALQVVGFKANCIAQVPPAALPPALRWLILTDNALASLPSVLGQRAALQKLMLAGNQLQGLPESLQDAHRLELLRLSVNRLTHVPAWLTELPRLSWLALAGNAMGWAGAAGPDGSVGSNGPGQGPTPWRPLLGTTCSQAPCWVKALRATFTKCTPKIGRSLWHSNYSKAR